MKNFMRTFIKTFLATLAICSIGASVILSFSYCFALMANSLLLGVAAVVVNFSLWLGLFVATALNM